MASSVVKFRFLTAAQVTRLHNTLVTSAQPTQPSMLESAVQSPINIKHYTNEQNVFQLAASLTEKIMKNHAFQDGNKRTALVAADMFLKINGYRLQKVPLQPGAEAQTLEDALVAVCTDKMTAEQLGQYYQQVATAIEDWTLDIMAYRDEATEY
jgi:death-on-curing family protein